jgi:hypothetical protein
MSQLLHIDAAYKQWIQELSLRYRQSQIKASIRQIVSNLLMISKCNFVITN